ncbi:unnamed protein product, partial [Candidula unifasciata]
CDAGTYGPSCQHNCSDFCLHPGMDSPCDGVTGDCLYGCESSYQPPLCITLCDPGMYGPKCELTCSTHCYTLDNNTVPCNSLDGICLYGCEDGYSEATCNVSCSVGKYGKRCELPCSEHCAPSNESTVSSCHQVTGDCNFGCKIGHFGTTCDK